MGGEGSGEVVCSERQGGGAGDRSVPRSSPPVGMLRHTTHNTHKTHTRARTHTHARTHAPCVLFHLASVPILSLYPITHIHTRRISYLLLTLSQAEPACAASLAALYTGRIKDLQPKSVVVIVCGGSVVSLADLLRWQKEFEV